MNGAGNLELSLQDNQDLKIIGHRGSKEGFFENTIPAFLASYNCGSYGVELDLQITKDDKVIIYHDYEFHPLKRLIKDINYEEIQAHKFPDGSKVPLLSELFQAFKNKPHLEFNLELKREAKNPDLTKTTTQITSLVLEVIKGAKFENRVYYSSFDVEILRELRKKDPSLILAFLVESEDFQNFKNENYFKEIADELSIEILSVPSSVINIENLNYLRSICKRIVVWTVNDLDDFEKLLRLGIREIITDTPRKFSLKK
jgi:glycerophosphoryl diester phosphodiesterase